MDQLDLDAIAKGLALVPSGCCVLTAAGPSGRTGMLASWVQQAAFEPPMVTVAVKRGRPIETLLQESPRFTLNMLGEDPKPLFRHFGRGFSLDQDAFAGIASVDTPYGVRLEAAAGTLSCELTHIATAGDHNVYIARVVEAQVVAGARPYVHLRKNGLSY